MKMLEVEDYLMISKDSNSMVIQLQFQIRGDNNTKFLIMMDTHFMIQIQG